MKPIILKLMSLAIGANLWFIFSQQQYDTISATVPLCFYNLNNNITIEAPETIQVSLAGKRSDLATLDIAHLAIHKRGDFSPQTSLILIQSHDLFLPESIKLIHYTPSPLLIRVRVQNNQL